MKAGTNNPSHEPVIFRGGPYGLTAVVTDATEALAEYECTIAGDGKRDVLGVARPDVDPRVLRLVVPPRTPAGTYKGAVRIGAAEREAVFEVHAIPELRFFPERCHFRVAPGGKIRAEWHVLNNGNTPVEIRSMLAFGIFVDGGLEHALRQAYTSGLQEGQRRVDVLADRLAEAHGGLVKMSVAEGSGSLGIGELRRLKAELHLAEKLEAGKTYRGNLELPGLVYPMVFEVRDKERDS